MKELKHYKVIKTDDGSYTYYSNEYQELCHSNSGAEKETYLHYIVGCDIGHKLSTQAKVNILEVGFGAGIGFLETQKLFSTTEASLYFASFEIDVELIHAFEVNHNIKFDKENNSYIYTNNNITLEIFHGNARDSIKQLQKKFHAIYQDAFSPKRNAILWTTEWFRDLRLISHKDCIMSTYSSSSSIRKSMLAAGWNLQPGQQFGKKRTSTRALLTGESDPEIIDRVRRSPVIEITDKNYIDYTMDN